MCIKREKLVKAKEMIFNVEPGATPIPILYIE